MSECMYMCVYVGLWANGAVKTFPHPAVQESPTYRILKFVPTEFFPSERRQYTGSLF